jgi:uncharacterized protein
LISLWLIGLLAPFSIAAGLLVFKSVRLTFLLYQGVYCAGIPLIDLLLVRRPPTGEIRDLLGLHVSGRRFLRAVVPAAGVLALMTAFFVLFRNVLVDADEVAALLRNWRIGRDALPVFLPVMALVNPVVEELYWRGYYLGRLKERMSVRRAILVSAFFYASYHFITTASLFNVKIGTVFTAVIFGAGVFWGWMRERTGSVAGPILMHAAADWAVLIPYLLYVHGRLS